MVRSEEDLDHDRLRRAEWTAVTLRPAGRARGWDPAATLARGYMPSRGSFGGEEAPYVPTLRRPFIQDGT